MLDKSLLKELLTFGKETNKIYISQGGRGLSMF